MRLFLIFVACFGWASAFGTVGIYERVYYYYAYLLDAELNGTPTSVAPGCSKGSSTKGLCSFNQFNQWIFNADPKSKPPPKDGFAVTNAQFPDGRVIDEGLPDGA
jgi:hypothetical protein